MALKPHMLEPLTPAVGDGVTTVFTTSTPYIAGSFVGIVRGLPRVAANDDGFTETSPAAGTVTFKEAPEVDDPVLGIWLEEVADAPETILEELTTEIRDLDRIDAVINDQDTLNADIADQSQISGTVDDTGELSATIFDLESLDGSLEEC